MTTKKAIERADALRLNSIGDEQKYDWLSALDGQLAEIFGIEPPVYKYPTDDRELLMPPPYDEIYQLYLILKIDYYTQEMKLYANDKAMYDAALAEALAWYQRKHRSHYRKNWRV